MMFVAIDTKRAFASTGDKIRLTVMEVIFCTTASNLDRQKNLHNWVRLTVVFLNPLITKVVILYNQDTSKELLKIFNAKIAEY